MTREEMQNLMVNSASVFSDPVGLMTAVKTIGGMKNAHFEADIALMISAQMTLGSIAGMISSGLGAMPDINDLTPELEPRLRATLDVIEGSAKALREFLDTHTGKRTVQ